MKMLKTVSRLIAYNFEFEQNFTNVDVNITSVGYHKFYREGHDPPPPPTFQSCKLKAIFS